ncbi:MAG: NUDIX domain-containing protein, partial [Candidatus Aminicenantes bacterium]|nr:NUDIX domain-containing protein [Candidatus Aminicenantes bacterium]
VCRPRNPLCLLCPLRPSCLAADRGRQELIPPPSRTATKRIEAVVAVIRKDGRLLIQKRPPGGLLADLWEFPGGKRKRGESREQALRREVREELGIEVASARPLTSVKHAYTQFLVNLHAFEVIPDREPGPLPGRRRWVSLHRLRTYPLPSGTVRLVEFLERAASQDVPRPETSGPWK